MSALMKDPVTHPLYNLISGGLRVTPGCGSALESLNKSQLWLWKPGVVPTSVDLAPDSKEKAESLLDFRHLGSVFDSAAEAAAWVMLARYLVSRPSSKETAEAKTRLVEAALLAATAKIPSWSDDQAMVQPAILQDPSKYEKSIYGGARILVVYTGRNVCTAIDLGNVPEEVKEVTIADVAFNISVRVAREWVTPGQR